MQQSHQMPSSANLPLASISGGIEAVVSIPIVEMSPSPAHATPFFYGRITTLPPGINKSYQVVKVPKKRTDEKKRAGEMVYRLGDTPEAAHFKEAAAWELAMCNMDVHVVNAIRAAYDKKKRVPLVVRVKFFFEFLWKRDVDGGEKHVVDAIFKHLGLNDVLMVDVHVTKEEYRSDPHVEFSVSCALDK